MDKITKQKDNKCKTILLPVCIVLALIAVKCIKCNFYNDLDNVNKVFWEVLDTVIAGFLGAVICNFSGDKKIKRLQDTINHLKTFSERLEFLINEYNDNEKRRKGNAEASLISGINSILYFLNNAINTLLDISNSEIKVDIKEKEKDINGVKDFFTNNEYIKFELNVKEKKNSV